MLLSQQDLHQFERLWGQSIRTVNSARLFEREQFRSFLGEHAFLFNTCGFHTWRTFGPDASEEDLRYLGSFFDPATAAPDGRVRTDNIGAPFHPPALTAEAVVHDRRTGQPLILYNVWGGEWDDPDAFDIVFRAQDGAIEQVSCRQLAAAISSVVSDPDAAPSTTSWNPKALHLPPHISLGSSPLASTSTALLHEVRSTDRELASLSPHEFEDLLGELFFEHGLTVRRTPRTHDGGRDLIVLGELIPGIVTTLAVEATTSPVVTMAKASKALHQNRHFPLVMLATTGRFSAGVIRERDAPDSQMRLILAEGQTVSDWIAGGWSGVPPRT